MDGLQPGDPAAVGGYQLVGRLGSGGMGQVFLGVSPGGRKVAVKLIHPVHASTEHFRERFAREVEAARRVGGFHTAMVVDADPAADPPWMITAFIDGPSLQETVQRDGPLRAERVRVIGAGLAEGLAAIHGCGLVHRDLKPGNVILATDGLRIIDFGIARAAGATALTSAGVVVGTYAYMSPEQVRGEQAGPASDVFSLGCVLTFAATGKPPFGTDAPAAVMFRIAAEPPDLTGITDPPLRELVAACLAKSPQARPPVQAILRALAGPRRPPASPVPVSPVPVSPSPSPSAPPPPTVTAAAAVPLPTRPPADGVAANGRGPLPAMPPPPTPTAATEHVASRWRRVRRIGVVAAAVVAAAVVIPVVLSTGSPGAAAGHDQGAGINRINISASSQGTPFHTTSPSPVSSRTKRAQPSSSPSPTRVRETHAPAAATSTSGTALIAGNVIAGPSDNEFGGLAFSPDDSELAIGDIGATKTYLYLYSVATGALTSSMSAPANGVDQNVGTGAAFSPDGDLVASGVSLGPTLTVWLWDVATGKLVGTLNAPSDNGDGGVTVAFSPNGQDVAAGNGGSNAYVWNVSTGQRLLTLTTASGNDAVGVAFSPNGTYIAGGSCGLTVWSATTGQQVATFSCPVAPGFYGTYPSFSEVAFSSDSSLVSGNGGSFLWNISTGALVRTIPADSPNGALGFSTTAMLVLTIPGGKTHGYLWNAATGKRIGTFSDLLGSESSSYVQAMAFSPDGKFLAAIDIGGGIHVWRVE